MTIVTKKRQPCTCVPGRTRCSACLAWDQAHLRPGMRPVHLSGGRPLEPLAPARREQLLAALRVRPRRMAELTVQLQTSRTAVRRLLVSLRQHGRIQMVQAGQCRAWALVEGIPSDAMD